MSATNATIQKFSSLLTSKKQSHILSNRIIPDNNYGKDILPSIRLATIWGAKGDEADCTVLIRGNFVAALLGTIVGNPITFPFIWGLIYKVGAFVTSSKQNELNQEINFDMIITQTYDIFLPMLLGGAILAIPVWLTTYLLTHSFVSSYKKSKIKKNKILKR